MTGFATEQDGAEGVNWTWEMRGVNARGFDLRLRLPEGIDGLEALVRGRISGRVTRGSVSVSLRCRRDASAGSAELDGAVLTGVLEALAEVAGEAARLGLPLRKSSAAEIMALRGVYEPTTETETALTPAMLTPSLDALLEAFDAMRAAEGTELTRILAAHLDRVEELLSEARAAAVDRAAETAENFRTALARVIENADGADADRVAQELAIMAVKADVTEELDRLDAHVKAARDLLAGDGPVGRKLDFLMQEFNREANTLCSKSGHEALTRAGLDLKAVIDQMREQVQNVE